MDVPGTSTPAVEYPTRDGRPMGETDEHRDELQDYGVRVLWGHFLARPDAYVGGNNFVYYKEGVPKDCVSPDVYVVFGVKKAKRPIFQVWMEGGNRPSFVLEITSKKTRREDLGDKMAKYRDRLEVPEYFLFDLHRDWIPERLRGFRLVEGGYVPIPPLSSGRLPSQALGLELGVLDGHIRFFLPGATEPIPTQAEGKERSDRRAEEERHRAEEERRRAEEERQRGDRLDAEVRALREELKKRQGDP